MIRWTSSRGVARRAAAALRLTAWLATFGMVAAGASLTAQPRDVPIGSRLERGLSTMPLQQTAAGKIRDYFRECVYSRNAEKIDDLLTKSDLRTLDYKAIGVAPRHFETAFAMTKCLNEGTKFSGTDLVLQTSTTSFRNMMVEASYLHHFPAPPDWLANIPTVQRRFVSSGEKLDAARALADFSDCVVKSAPRESDALLRTPSGSAEEQAGAKTLVPFLGPCIAAGQTVELNIESIRNYVADGLWTASGQLPVTSERAS